MMFLPGGHMGPPLRQASRMRGDFLTHFVLKVLLFCTKKESTNKSVHVQCYGIIVGADPCVRPW